MATPDAVLRARFALPEDSTLLLDDAVEYRVGDDIFIRYRFPFTVLDSTPGGANLGRISWHLELLPKKKHGRYRIGTIALWATQTRDARYQKRIFLFHSYAEAIAGTLLGTHSHFIRQTWRTGFCTQHKTPIFEAYPNDYHTALIVQIGSSISDAVYFE